MGDTVTLSSDELQAAAKQHLWMHFTRMSSYNNGDVPVIVRGSGPYVYDDKGKRYLDGLAGLFVSMVGPRPHRAGRGRRPSRPPSWPTSRCGPTRTRRRCSSPPGSPSSRPAT